MSLTVDDIRPATAAEWDALWRGCEYATFFHSREWAEVWQAYLRGAARPDPRLVTFSDGRRALLPLSYRRRLAGLVKAYVSSHAGTFGGWIAEDDLGPEHAALLAGPVARRLGNLVWKVNPYDEHSTASGAETTQADETLVLPLDEGFEAVRRRWTKGHRSAASKARREGVLVRAATTRDDWRAYYAVFEDSQRRWGEATFAAYDWRLFEELFRRHSPDVKLWLASVGRQVVAGALCLYARRHVVYWHGAALEEHFPRRPVHLLLSDVIEDACARGHRWFDFNPSGPLKGVAAFKKSFGAVALPCPNVRIEPAWWRLAREAKSKAQQWAGGPAPRQGKSGAA